MRVVALVSYIVFLTSLALALAVDAASSEPANVGSAAEAGIKRYFAVTLRSSFTPISDKQAKRDFPDYAVYLLQGKAFGKDVYNLRAGFFENYADATAFRDIALAKYPSARVTEISSNEFTVIVRTFPTFKMLTPATPVKKPEAPKTPTAPPPPAVAAVPPAARPGAFSSKALFAVLLEKSPKPITGIRAPLPDTLKNYRLYTAQVRDKEKTNYELKLGFFEKVEDVYAAQKKLKAEYPDAKVVRITPEEQNDSVRTALVTPVVIPPAVATVPPVAPKPAPVPVAPEVIPPAVATVPPVAPKSAPVPVAPEELPSIEATGPPSSYDREAQALMEKSRAALARGDNASAITLLDKLLRLPPNKYSQDAQEYIGLARERAGETTAARKEYELYLSLYPTGDGADRVRQRIAVLEAKSAPVPTPALRSVRPRVVPESSIVGSLSQYYYHGASKVDTTSFTPGTNIASQASLNQTDQSSLLTNLILTQRYRSEEYDNRFVIRDTYTKNFLQGQEDTNRPSAVYYEVKDRLHDYGGRIGRQPGGAAGVLGTFDGLQAGYNFTPKWRLNVVGGVPVDITYDSSLHFYGTSMEIGPYADHWGATLYVIEQTVDGVTDRKAVGSELRYFDPSFNVFGLFDYDTEFQASNITLIQGNWTGGGGTTAHALYDRRKTPALELVNSLMGESDTSISSQLQTKTYDQLKQQALDNTATTELKGVGVTQQLSTHWQTGLDVQSSRTSATVGSINQPPLPDTGITYTYTGTVTGSGLFSPRDVTVFSLTHIDGKTYAGNLFSLTNRVLWGANWSLDTVLNWYKQHDSSTDLDLKRFSPSLKPSYKWKNNITLEAEIGLERTESTGPVLQDTTRRRYWSLGYRWDF
jgi:tetratricopeptide (TPR) repeat protein